jgi:hypothetical protein
MTLGETPEDAANYVASGGMGRATFATIAPDRRSTALNAIRDALAEHQGAGGVVLDGAILITSALV